VSEGPAEVCIEVRRLCKCFRVLRFHKTTFKALSRMARREPSRGRHWVLRDVGFRVRHGEKLAVVGRNGCGKSTLLRLLCGIYDATEGEVRVARPPRALFDVTVGTLSILPVIDNLFLYGATHAIPRPRLEREADGILDLAGLSHLRFSPFQDLSLGQKRRFALAVFLRSDAELLIFDEALANLDLGFVRECERHFEKLRSSDRTLVMTSHDGDFLRRHCERALWLDDGRLRMDGPIDEVLEAYEESF
jgi:ABC-type polysaccharide/polyol phosphate transport system ATPase subunit